MKLKLYNLEKKVLDEIEVNNPLYETEVRVDLMHRVVVWQMAKRRLGTRKAKNRSEVNRRKQKAYKQKGTGNARRGSLNSPILVGGGVAFGPVVRSHAFSLPKKIRKLALLHAINDKIKNNAMFIVDQIEFDRPSIKNILSVKDSFELNSALFVTIDKDNNLMLSCSNLKGFDSIALVGLNVYDIIKHKSLFFTKVAWQQFCGE